MDCLRYHENAKTKHFYDSIFEKRAIPTVIVLLESQNIWQVLLITY